jgi:hypothetical protein
MKDLRTSMKVFVATKTKCAVVCVLSSLAFVSQASGVLRSLFPAKPAPPFSDEVIVIGDDFVLRVQKPGNNDGNQMKGQLTRPSKRIQSEAERLLSHALGLVLRRYSSIPALSVVSVAAYAQLDTPSVLSMTTARVK